MSIILIFCMMLSMAYFLQSLVSLFVHYNVMQNIKSLNLVYQEKEQFKKFLITVVILFVIIVIIRLTNWTWLILITPVITFSGFSFLKKFYDNTIKTDGEYIYNGVATIRISAIKKVFLEEGSNLEKKYHVQYKGLGKYLYGRYLVFQLKSGEYILLKNYTDGYLEQIKSIINVE